MDLQTDESNSDEESERISINTGILIQNLKG